MSSLYERSLATVKDALATAPPLSSLSTPAVIASVVSACYLCRKLVRRMRAVNLSGGIAIVTGASQGIGAQIAKLLATRGARVILLARTKSKLRDVEHEINKIYHDAAKSFCVDCANPEEVQKIANHIRKVYGAPDLIVNCAGAGQWRTLYEMTVEQICTTIDSPLLASVFVTRAFLPDMIRKNKGQIVNVQSPAAMSPFAGATMYSTMRFALRGLTRALQADLRKTNIIVQEIILAETKSSYWENNPGSQSRVPWISSLLGSLSPQKAARGVLYGIESGAPLYIYPYSLRACASLHQWIPSVVNFTVSHTGWSLDPARHVALPAESHVKDRRAASHQHTDVSVSADNPGNM